LRTLRSDTSYGEVEDVRLKERPTPRGGESATSITAAGADEALAVLQEGGGTRCAIGFLVFRTSKGLKAVLSDTLGRLAAPRPAKGGKKDADSDTAGQQLLRRFRARQPQVRALQAEVDAAMAAFEAAEAEEERQRKTAAEQPDADGFVTVTYGRKKKRRRGGEGMAGEGGKQRGGARTKRKKKKGYELQNFYAHQIREAKREQLARLRARFEEDKARIERMKAARKFKPFG
jgi:ribosomal RNA-processing protein 7